MTREETQKILFVVDASYPNFKVNGMTQTIDTWHFMLSDYSYEDVMMALKAFITSDTSGFSPSIGQLVGMMEKKNEMSESEAWAQVKKCLRDITAPDRDAYAELPDVVKRAIGGKQIALQWSYMDSEKVDTVVASNFKRDYRAELNRARIDHAMPDYLPNRMIEQYAPAQIERIDVDDEMGRGVPMPDGMMDDVKGRLS